MSKIIVVSRVPGVDPTDVTAPTTPAITASVISSASLQIALNTASTDVGGTGVASYTLQRATDSGFTLNLSTTNGILASDFPLIVTGLGASTQYFFRLRAVDGAGNLGTFSATTNATTSSAGGGGAVGINFDSGFSGTGVFNQDDQSFTINDANSRFDTKPNAGPPLANYDFGLGGTSSSAGSRAAYSMDFGATQTTFTAPNRSAAWRWQINDSTRDGVSSYKPLASQNYADIYAFFRMYQDWDGLDAYASLNTNWNHKGLRVWHSGNAKDWVVGYGQDQRADGNPRMTLEGISPLQSEYGNGVPLRKNAWRTEQYEMHQSSANGVADGTWTAYDDGRNIGGITGVMTRVAAQSDPLFRIAWHQAERIGVSGKSIWYDRAYFDDSRCRLEVRGSSTYTTNAAYDLALWIPATWAAGSITGKTRRDTFADLAGNWLFATTRTGAKVRVGQLTT